MSELQKMLNSPEICTYCGQGPFPNLMTHFLEKHPEKAKRNAGSLSLTARNTRGQPPPQPYVLPRTPLPSRMYPSPPQSYPPPQSYAAPPPPQRSFQDVVRETSEEGGKAMGEYEEGMLAEEAAASAKPPLLQLAEVQERMDGSLPGGMGSRPEGIELDPLPRYRAAPPSFSEMEGGRRRSRKSRNRSRKNPRRSRRQHKKRR